MFNSGDNKENSLSSNPNSLFNSEIKPKKPQTLAEKFKVAEEKLMNSFKTGTIQPSQNRVS